MLELKSAIPWLRSFELRVTETAGRSYNWLSIVRRDEFEDGADAEDFAAEWRLQALVADTAADFHWGGATKGMQQDTESKAEDALEG